MSFANKEGQPAPTGLAQDSANVSNISPDVANPSLRAAEGAKAEGMAAALNATAPELRAAITQALLVGFDQMEPRRAEDALARAGFAWPAAAPATCLGPIVASLARLGLITEVGWAKGRMLRSHRGRVSIWLLRGVS